MTVTSRTLIKGTSMSLTLVEALSNVTNMINTEFINQEGQLVGEV